MWTDWRKQTTDRWIVMSDVWCCVWCVMMCDVWWCWVMCALCVPTGFIFPPPFSLCLVTDVGYKSLSTTILILELNLISTSHPSHFSEALDMVECVYSYLLIDDGLPGGKNLEPSLNKPPAFIGTWLRAFFLAYGSAVGLVDLFFWLWFCFISPFFSGQGPPRPTIISYHIKLRKKSKIF